MIELNRYFLSEVLAKLRNGWFIDQDAESLAYRRATTDWVVRQAPARIADFSGGFGGLAVFVGQALPNARVKVVERQPRAVAVAMAANTPNARFVRESIGEYELLVEKDVSEYVPDCFGLLPTNRMHYGRAYRRIGPLDLAAACKMAEGAKRLYPLIRSLPCVCARVGALGMHMFGTKA